MQKWGGSAQNYLELFNDPKAVRTTITKTTIGSTLHRNRLKSCSALQGENDPKSTIPTAKHEGENIMLWSYLSFRGTELHRDQWTGACIVNSWTTTSFPQQEP